MVVQSQKRPKVARARRSPKFFSNKRIQDILLPIVGTLAFLIIWQIFSSSGLTRLPGPVTLWTNDRTRELLLYPFYDNGGLDKGLFWQTLASLGRVAKGYSAAAIVGIAVGVLGRRQSDIKQSA